MTSADAPSCKIQTRGPRLHAGRAPLTRFEEGRYAGIFAATAAVLDRDEIAQLLHGARATLSCHTNASGSHVAQTPAPSAFKRVFAAKPAWFDAWADAFIDDVAGIDQPSAQWTVAQLVRVHATRLDTDH